MDPNKTLEKILEAANALDASAADSESTPSETTVEQLVANVLALDLWMRNGGYMPKAWTELRSAR